MSISTEIETNLTSSINGLYNNELQPGEAQTAERYLLDFFQILNSVSTKLECSMKTAKKGCNNNGN
jgi:hypothetical protein